MKKKLILISALFSFSSLVSAAAGPTLSKNLSAVLNETPELQVDFAVTKTFYSGTVNDYLGTYVGRLSFTTKGLTSIDVISNRKALDGSASNRFTFYSDSGPSKDDKIQTTLVGAVNTNDLTLAAITSGIKLTPKNGQATLPSNFSLDFKVNGATSTVGAGNYTSLINVTSVVL